MSFSQGCLLSSVYLFLTLLLADRPFSSYKGEPRRMGGRHLHAALIIMVPFLLHHHHASSLTNGIMLVFSTSYCCSSNSMCVSFFKKQFKKEALRLIKVLCRDFKIGSSNEGKKTLGFFFSQKKCHKAKERK